nr:2-oxoacid:ferredoxin oxidoreductase subunit beta [Coprothermobacter proteolyticus]
EKLPIGIFYQVEQVPTYHERLLGDLNIATQRAPKEQRWESIRTLLQQST